MSTEPSAKSRKQRLRLVLLVLGPLVVLIGGLFLYLSGGRYISVDNAYVKAGMLSVSTDVSGTVAEVAVRDNQVVQPGQMLYRLDDTPFRIALAGAQAKLATARNDIEALRATYRQKQADISQAEADVGFYSRDHDRQAALVGKYVSQAQYDVSNHNLIAARQKLVSLKQEAQSVLASLGGNPDIAVENHPTYLAAKAQLDQAQRDLDHVRVVAPFAGIVSKVDSVQVGSYLPAATAAFSLVATDDVWVEANPKETDLANVRAGQPVTVTIDSYPDYIWHGTLVGLSPASGAEFAVLPPQNASGNWVKVVQRIPLRINLERADNAPPLRAGMSATVEIDTGRSRSLFGKSAAAAPYDNIQNLGAAPVQQ
ncbi:MAG TPA: HlyD family secretion protein [Alphaproteobacteria bacterium]|nr:HlyD family secretion protein [Alphaproteobacteria bacterium]